MLYGILAWRNISRRENVGCCLPMVRENRPDIAGAGGTGNARAPLLHPDKTIRRFCCINGRYEKRCPGRFIFDRLRHYSDWRYGLCRGKRYSVYRCFHGGNATLHRICLDATMALAKNCRNRASAMAETHRHPVLPLHRNVNDNESQETSSL